MQLAINLLFKPKYNQLGCGLFGVASDDVNSINIDKLKILGIFNDSRGGHSCGVTIDGDIMIGTYTNKLFKDFISDNDVDVPDTVPTILGHTRYATGGAHNTENSHPFGYGNNQGMFRFIGTHNGSLHNKSELAKKFNVSETDTYKNAAKVTVTRDKIDSEILLECIYKSRSFEVLSLYEGAAALAFYDTTKPNVMYLYHGSSPKFKNATAIEERPLFYYQKDDNTLYYSSLKDSLKAIQSTKGEIISLPTNRVYKITDGNIATAEIFPIDRSKAGQFSTKVAATSNIPSYWNNTTKKWTASGSETRTLPASTAKTTSLKTTSSPLEDSFLKKRKSMDTKVHSEVIYYEKLRYFKGLNLLEGIYAVDNDMKLHHVSDTYADLLDKYKSMDKSELDPETLDKPIFVAFVKGIQLKTIKEYALLKENFSSYTLIQLSHAAAHPIKDITYEFGLAYLDGSSATKTFRPLFGEKIFELTYGTCRSVKDAEPKDYLQSLHLVPSDNKIEEDVLERMVSHHQGTTTPKASTEVEDEEWVVMYEENLLSVIENCKDSAEESIVDNTFQQTILSKLKAIQEFINTTLKL